MFLFVVYAALFWWLSVKHRRTWTGFAWAIGGFLGLCLLGYIHYRMDIWTNHRIYLPVLQTILYPYAALVLIVSLFLASLPPKFRGIACRQCGYDLTGLEVARPRCPECGRQHAVVSARPMACAMCSAEMKQLSSHEPACPECRTYHLVIGPRPAHGYVESADRGVLIEPRAAGRAAHSSDTAALATAPRDEHGHVNVEGVEHAQAPALVPAREGTMADRFRRQRARGRPR